MKMKPYFIVFILFYLSFNRSSAQSYFQNDTLHINVPTYTINDLDAYNYNASKTFITYRFKKKLEDNIAFAAKDFNDVDWEYTDSNILSNEEAIQTIWYRFKMQIDSQFVGHPLVLIFDAEGILELYIDGELHSQIGNFPSDSTTDISYYYLDSKPIQLVFTESKMYQIAVRFKSNVNKADGSKMWFHINIEDGLFYLNQVKNGSIFSSMACLGIGTIFFSLFLVHGLFFLFYRVDKSNLIFAIFTLSIALSLLGIYTYSIATQTTYNTIYNLCFNYIPIISCFSLCAFISHIFIKNQKVQYGIIGLCIIVLFFAALDAYNLFDFSAVIIWILLIISLLYTIVMIIWAMVKKIPGSVILGSGVLYFLIFSLGLIVISLIKGSVIFNYLLIALSAIAILGIPLSISAFLAWRFSTTSKNLLKQIKIAENLSVEKQNILENQNELLELQVNERTQELQAEKQKADDLLLNILPHEVAEELKATGTSKAQHYDEVSVLFTDFVNFTMASEQLGAEELLHELNENFTAFDQIMEKNGLEKIKTIGDAYLAVSGLPVKNERHAQQAIAAALDILAFVKERKLKSKFGLDIRIGIHSGPLVAGIVGVKKFAFDIWGDTVNTAARMEQSSEAGKVNVSESTYHLVKEEYTCTARGKINAKGKGEMEMYFVEKQ